MPFKTSTARGQRGKPEERAVRDFLDAYDRKHLAFDYLQLPDARAAMGHMKSMPGDFEYYSPDAFGIIEVKAVHHDFRFPKKNATQLARLMKRELAGGVCFFLIHHTTSDKWRVLRPEQLPFGPPSWDLQQYPAYNSAAEALYSTGVFIHD